MREAAARRSTWGAAAAGALLLAGCATAPTPDGALIADPYEATNRQIHEFNKGVDTALLSPLAQGYAFVTPATIQHMVSNGLDHLKLPAIFINRLLQGDAEEAGAALARFSLNTIIGAGGLLDPAREFGLPYTPTDFGVTLAVWGAEEGVYHEAPFFGPLTTRHLVGRIVNVGLDPSILITTGAVEVATAVELVDMARTPVDAVTSRAENAELVDQILYESEDSYVTARTAYVQARRRTVSGEPSVEEAPDIFGD